LSKPLDDGFLVLREVVDQSEVRGQGYLYTCSSGDSFAEGGACMVMAMVMVMMM
jgi:hypothetical protein